MAGYRPIYTIDEDNHIIDFIVNSKSYYHLKGTAMWMDMEKTKILDRTWQSLKERFDKTIVPRINDSRYKMRPAEKKKLQLALYQLTTNIPDKSSSDEDKRNSSC